MTSFNIIFATLCFVVLFCTIIAEETTEKPESRFMFGYPGMGMGGMGMGGMGGGYGMGMGGGYGMGGMGGYGRYPVSAQSIVCLIPNSSYYSTDDGRHVRSVKSPGSMCFFMRVPLTLPRTAFIFHNLS